MVVDKENVREIYLETKEEINIKFKDCEQNKILSRLFI